MLYKPLVALFMAFAATGSVAASTTPVRRGGGYAPPPLGRTIPARDCESNTNLYCCQRLTSTSDPSVADSLSSLVGVGSDALAGLDCTNIGVLSNNPTCEASPICCEDIKQTGVVNLGCTRVSL